MVRKLSFLVLLLTVFLTAAICKLFTASPFPSYLTQISAYIDLNKEMDGFIGRVGEDFNCGVYVLKNSSGREYIFVGICSFSPEKKKVIILDNSLKVRKELESPDLGELNMVDVNGDFLIGKILFDQVDLTLSLPNGAIDPYWQGFSDGADNFLMWIDSGFPDELRYEPFNASWGGGSIQSELIGSDSFQLENVSFNQSNYLVALLLREDSSDAKQIILVPAGDFSTPPLMTPLVDYPGFELENAKSEGFGLTNDGIVVGTHDRVTKLYGFDGKVKAEFPLVDDHSQIQAYDTGGEYYYHLDTRARRLYKCGTWW